MKACLRFSLPFLTFAVVSFGQGPDSFAGKCVELGQAAEQAGKPAIQGADEDWFFLTKELLHCGTGAFWEKDWAQVAANGQDPVPFLIQFRDLLAAKGIRLLMVPVPAKAAIYPDKLSGEFGPADPLPVKAFIDQIAAAGIYIVDLEPVFRAEREAGAQLYCQGDAHFSPHACQLISKLVRERVAPEAWYQSQPKVAIERGPETTLTIVGDLVPENWKRKAAETLSIRYCGKAEGGKLVPVEPQPDSPVLLLGDSHTLVFNEGATRAMHCKGAGLLDQLQADLGFPLDLVGVRGSGSRAARIQLYRHADSIPGYWENKKLVIWCFSVREFTQSFDKLIEVPIERE